MRRPIFFVLLIGCHGGRGNRLFASGSVELLPEAFANASSAAQIDALMATEVEHLKGDGLSAKRRGGSTIIDVTAPGVDAAARCNQALRTYLDRRLERLLMSSADKIHILSDELERLPPEERPPLKEKIRSLEEERRLQKRDAVLMAPCKLVAL